MSHSPSRRPVALLVAVFAVLVCASSAAGGDNPFERVSITSSPNPVGAGARAQGMGGAHVAVADDATAASWNPAGLVQLLRPEISAVGLFRCERETREGRDHPEAEGSDRWNDAERNFVGAVWPFAVGRFNMAVSANRLQVFDFERTMDLVYSRSAESGPSGPILSQRIDVRHEQDYRADGDLSAVGLGYAVELRHDLALGVNVNIWDDDIVGDNEWTVRERAASTGEITVNASSGVIRSTTRQILDRTDRRILEHGANANIGLLWSVTPRWTLGAVWKTPFRADVSREFSSVSRDPAGRAGPRVTRRDEDEEIDFPSTFALGVAYRRNDFLSFSVDATRVAWDHFRLHEADGDTVSPLTGRPPDESDVPPTWAFRGGVEYLKRFRRVIVPLRAGVFYDPEPLGDGVRDAWGVSLGAGVVLGDRAQIDAAVVHRRAESVPFGGVDGTDIDGDRTLVVVSTVFYF